MVIKGLACGGANGGVRRITNHLLRTDTNEVAELRELRGVLADDLLEALQEMDAVASGTRSTRPFYHASINTRADECLTPEQQRRAIDRLETELGLTDQPRAVVAHVKAGRAHLHVVWSRIDLETMTAIPDSHNYRRHELVARELEREFGHHRVQGAHVERDGVARPARTPSHAEMQQAARTGLSPQEAKALITPLWQQTDNAASFAAALAENGWILARGDQRSFVVLDMHGTVHSLARRIDGAKVKDVKERLGPLWPTLPDVAAARQRQRDAGVAAGAAPEPDGHGDNLARLTALHDAIAALPQEDVAVVDFVAEGLAQRQMEREVAELHALAQAAELYRAAHPKGLTPDEERAQQQEEQRRRFLAETEREAEEARTKAQAHQQAEAARTANGDVADARSRYAQSVGKHYDILRPYQSLAAAATDEYGRFVREQEELKRHAAAATDPEQRQLIELRRQIEAHDYMAITSERLARISRVTTDDRNSEQAQRDDAFAAYYTEEGQKLRATRAALIQQRRERVQPHAEARVAEPQQAGEELTRTTPKAKRQAPPETRAAESPQAEAAPTPAGTPPRAKARADDDLAEQRRRQANEAAAGPASAAPRPDAREAAPEPRAAQERRERDARIRTRAEEAQRQLAQQMTMTRGRSR